MKKFFYSVIALAVLGSSVAFAATTPTTLKGTIICNACATKHKDDLAAEIATHTKVCVLKGPCSASGFSFYSDGKLKAFNKDSYSKIQDFLKQDSSTLKVEVQASEENGQLTLVSIKNQ